MTGAHRAARPRASGVPALASQRLGRSAAICAAAAGLQIGQCVALGASEAPQPVGLIHAQSSEYAWPPESDSPLGRWLVIEWAVAAEHEVWGHPR